MKYRKQFDVWWRNLTFKGDPLHRPNLTGEAFDAGFEAGRKEALFVLTEDIRSGNYRPSAQSITWDNVPG